MNAAQSPPKITDPRTLALWATYEAQSRRAKLQYVRMPISLGRAGTRSPCSRRQCGRKTESITGVCRDCEKAARCAGVSS